MINPLPCEPSRTLETGPNELTESIVAASITSVMVVPASDDTRKFFLTNISSSACLINFGAPASATNYVIYLPPEEVYESYDPCFTGQIFAIWEVATGTLHITRLAFNLPI